MKADLTSRFEAKFIRAESGCWLWQASLDSSGYGVLWDGAKNQKAHRVSWNLHNGEIPAGMCVLHRCDMPACVNPAHLFLGTNDDNVADKVAKGRGHRPTGTRNPKARLSIEQVLAIRHDERVQQVIADDYGIAQTLVSKIKSRTLWSHV